MQGVYEIKNKNGTISYRVQIYDEDPDIPGKYKIYAKTFPGHTLVSSKKDVEIYKERIKAQWRSFVSQKIDDAKNNIVKVEEDITLIAYARNWLAEIEATQSHSYYERGLGAIEKFQKYFGDIKLADIKRADIQKFIDSVCREEIGTAYATIKNQSVSVLENSYTNLNNFCNEIGLTRNTILTVRQGYRVEIKTAEIICSHLNISLKKHFNIFANERHYAKYTVHGFFRILRAILGHALHRDVIKTNPAYGQGVVKISTRDNYRDSVTEDKVFSYDEYKQFQQILLCNIAKVIEQYDINKPEKDYYDIRKNILFLVGIHTGLRNGELCGLQWGDIDLLNRKLRVVRNAVYTSKHGVCVGNPKSRTSIRTISISSPLAEQLSLYKKWWDRENEIYDAEEPFLFLRDNGKLIHPSTPSSWLDKLLKEIGMKHVSMHGLRHTHATISIVNFKADIKTVSCRLGHSSVALTLNVYTHFIPKSDQDLADLWNAD